MKVGCHVSIAGGIANVSKRAADLGCEVFQMFSRSPQGGSAPVITPEIAENFKQEMKKWKQENCYIHAPYYINFASSKKSIRASSVRIVREELERGNLIGAKYVMFHPGSAKDLEREEALKITAEGVKEVLKGYQGSTRLLLEISAGAGNVIGDSFEELAYIIKHCLPAGEAGGGKPGVCLDTAHMFASGYDIKDKEKFKKVVEVISNTIGLDKIELIHANDSKIELGGRKDRHDHIGHGKIGEEGFKNLLSVFPKLDMICETEHDLVKEDMERLKGLRYNK